MTKFSNFMGLKDCKVENQPHARLVVENHHIEVLYEYELGGFEDWSKNPTQGFMLYINN